MISGVSVIIRLPKVIIFLACLILLLSPAPSGSVHAESGHLNLYYFNPDSAINNMGRLKREIERCLAGMESQVSFQPFAHLVDFDRQVREMRPDFLFLPEWYFQKYGAALKIKPFLLNLRRGTSSYHKILLADQNSGVSLDNLKNRTLAMTSMGPDSKEILNKILFANQQNITAEELNLLFVPKDSDALFALALGQVELALVVKDSMAEIGRINPGVVRNVRPLLESGAIGQPYFCFMEGAISEAEVEKFKESLLKGGSEETRRKIKEMLQVDEWQEYTH